MSLPARRPENYRSTSCALPTGKAGRRWSTKLGLFVVTTALLAAGCGRGVTRESLIDDFAVANPDVTATQAECVVDRLLSDRDLTEIEAELAADEIAPGFEEDQFRAMFVCGIEGDVGDQITEQLVTNGVSPDDAPCVADELTGQLTDADIDVLLSGEITDEFYAKFFAAMESCGAVG